MFDKNVDKTSMLMNNAHNRAFDIWRLAWYYSSVLNNDFFLFDAYCYELLI